MTRSLHGREGQGEEANGFMSEACVTYNVTKREEYQIKRFFVEGIDDRSWLAEKELLDKT